MNLCRSCSQDFGSVSAFDAHRVGKHAYTFAEGLAMDREDGRRCLHTDELTQAGWRRDQRGRWRTPADTRRLFAAVYGRGATETQRAG